MTRNDIIQMAREAGFQSHHNSDLYDFMVANDRAIERFAALVAAAEREACAKVCEDEDVAPTDDAVGVQQCIAAAIRARGQS
jgi:hypothetical protein